MPVDFSQYKSVIYFLAAICSDIIANYVTRFCLSHFVMNRRVRREGTVSVISSNNNYNL